MKKRLNIPPERQKKVRKILNEIERILLPSDAPDPLTTAHIEMGLADLVGLNKLKRMAQRDIRACLRVNEVFPHTGLFGPGGLGKTAFAMAMAKDLGYFFVQVEGAAVNNRQVLISLLKRACDGAAAHDRRALIFIDECHRLGSLQEVLYYPMTEWRVTTTDGDIRLTPFTLVAATTHPNMLMGSFISRLQNQWHMERYELRDIREIIHRQFCAYGITCDHVYLDRIGKRSLGVPRQAKNLCLKVRNSVLARGGTRVTDRDCFETFDLEGIDQVGLGRQHIQYLLELFNAQGVPKGLSALAGRLGLDEDVVSGSIEPVLLSLGMIDLTGRGRVLTRKGHLHLAQTGQI
jgi:Holliday junction resolvasome RuvABC ATP-dependent DNA helicase subunit